MVCITIRFLFMVISNNQLYLVHFFLFDGNQRKVSFFENSAWSMTKALCLNAIAPEASYSFFWLGLNKICDILGSFEIKTQQNLKIFLASGKKKTI